MFTVSTICADIRSDVEIGILKKRENKLNYPFKAHSWSQGWLA